MRKLTKAAVQKELSERLSLKEPEFRLSVDGDRINGHIISPTFKGKPDHKRQDMIWQALETAFGRSNAVSRVGMLLAYTPDEWYADEILVPAAKTKRKKAG
jgi:acid stress-induced BolA-like protein IbaG/YrbA